MVTAPKALQASSSLSSFWHSLHCPSSLQAPSMIEQRKECTLYWQISLLESFVILCCCNSETPSASKQMQYQVAFKLYLHTIFSRHECSQISMLMQFAKKALADFIQADEADVVHLTNATAAVNTILFSSKLRQGDLLLITSITYPAVSHLPGLCNHQKTLQEAH